jgi:hypothetical protein
MSQAQAESWDAPLRRALQGSRPAGLEVLHGARPGVLNAESAACLTSVVLAGFVCAAALFRARLAAGQLDLIASALRVVALAFVLRAVLSLGGWLLHIVRDGSASEACLVLGPAGLLLRLGGSVQAVERSDVLDVVAPEALPTRTLPARPLPVLVVLTPQAGRPRALALPPYFAQTSEVLLARMKRWLGSPQGATPAPAPAADDAPEAHYERAAAGQLRDGDVVIPEGRGYLLRAPWAALLGLWFAGDVYYSAGRGRALIALPVLGAALLSLVAIVSWFLWLRRRRTSRLGIGMLLAREELLLRGPHGVVAVPWPQLSQVEVQVSARWSPFAGTFATRLLSLATQSGEHMQFDASFLETPVDVVAVLCRRAAGRTS